MKNLGELLGCEDFAKEMENRWLYKLLHGAGTWLKYFNKAKAKNDVDEQRRMLTRIYNETVNIVDLGYYYTLDDQRVELPSPAEMERNTVFYDGNGPGHVEHIKSGEKTEYVAFPVDSIDAAQAMIPDGMNPVVLNMANRQHPGGGVHYGARAQEESLFRRTNLYRSLYQFSPVADDYNVPRRAEQYPMDRNFGGIYTPKATVFRANQDAGYALLAEPFQMSFISVAAINRPALNENGKMRPDCVEGTLNKMRTIFRIALLHGHDAIVLGAWGCGAFKNPPDQIAALFHQVLLEEEFFNKFKLVVFAILENHHSREAHNPEGNLLPFRREFTPDYYSMSEDELKKLADDQDPNAAFHLWAQADDPCKYIDYLKYAVKEEIPEAECALAVLLHQGLGVEQDHAEAIRLLKDAAELNFPDAFYLLGLDYKNGSGVEADLTHAHKMFMTAAQLGNTDAQFQAAMDFVCGNGTLKNEPQAFFWANKAAKAGHAEAEFMLGSFYFYGTGTKVHQDLAVKWMRKAAAHNNPMAIYWLGIRYENGDCSGIAKDADKARELYVKAADMNLPEAQVQLALMISNGDGFKPDPEKAFELLSKAAESGNPNAHFYLSQCFTEGFGCKKDLEKAFASLEIASAHLPEAEFERAMCLLTGTGTDKDVEKGEEIFFRLTMQGYGEASDMCRMAAENGNSNAQYAMAMFYRNQETPDYVKANEWDQRAAENGNADSMYHLYVAYSHGHGVEQDHRTAVRYLQDAMDHGNAHAMTIMGDMCRKGTECVQEDHERALTLYLKAVENGDADAMDA